MKLCKYCCATGVAKYVTFYNLKVIMGLRKSITGHTAKYVINALTYDNMAPAKACF